MAEQLSKPFRYLHIEATDGYPIAVREYLPEGTARSILVIAPAMGVKQSFYQPFAEWLASQGVLAVTFDYRGMGASRPATLKGFQADILDWATKDCAALVAHLDAQHPTLPMYWLGHSVGAQLFGLLPNRDRVTAMLSVAAGSGYWQYNAKPLRYYVLSLWWVMMPVALKVAGYFPGKRLGTVGDLPYGVAAQWRKWCLHKDYLGAEGEHVKAQVAGVTTPITALSMQDDELMTWRGTRALFGLYESATVEYKRMKPRELGVKRIGHFGFFRSSMKEALWPMVPEWIATQPQPQPLSG